MSTYTREDLLEAFSTGFLQSGEGFNAECNPFSSASFHRAEDLKRAMASESREGIALTQAFDAFLASIDNRPEKSDPTAC